jgi:hypothetical protein
MALRNVCGGYQGNRKSRLLADSSTSEVLLADLECSRVQADDVGADVSLVGAGVSQT